MKTTLKEYYDEDIEIIYTNSLKYCYYSILLGVMVDYKKQILITRIKSNMEYSICHIPPQKQKKLTKS